MHGHMVTWLVLRCYRHIHEACQTAYANSHSDAINRMGNQLSSYVAVQISQME